jgi:hypothetical protein
MTTAPIAYKMMLIGVASMFGVIAMSAAAGNRRDEIPIDDCTLIYDNDDLQSYDVGNNCQSKQKP